MLCRHSADDQGHRAGEEHGHNDEAGEEPAVSPDGERCGEEQLTDEECAKTRQEQRPIWAVEHQCHVACATCEQGSDEKELRAEGRTGRGDRNTHEGEGDERLRHELEASKRRARARHGNPVGDSGPTSEHQEELRHDR